MPMHKIKCNDGKVRMFMKSYKKGQKIESGDYEYFHINRIRIDWNAAFKVQHSVCVNCHHDFGTGHPAALKLLWVKHDCKHTYDKQKGW